MAEVRYNNVHQRKSRTQRAAKSQCKSAGCIGRHLSALALVHLMAKLTRAFDVAKAQGCLARSLLLWRCCRACFGVWWLCAGLLPLGPEHQQRSVCTTIRCVAAPLRHRMPQHLCLFCCGFGQLKAFSRQALAFLAVCSCSSAFLCFRMPCDNSALTAEQSVTGEFKLVVEFQYVQHHGVQQHHQPAMSGTLGSNLDLGLQALSQLLHVLGRSCS